MTSERPASSFVSTVTCASEEPALYQLIKRGDINPYEVEDASAQSVEVSVLWQVSILHVAHLDAAQGFTLTSATLRGEDPTRFVVDGEMLCGMTDARVIVQDSGETRFVFLPGSKGEIEIRGEKRSLDDLIAQGHAKPSTEVHGAFETAVVSGGRYRMEIGGLTVVAKVVARGRKFAAPMRTDRRLLASALGSLMAVGGMLGIARFAVTEDSSMVSAEESETRLADLRDFMARQTERQVEQQQTHEAAAVDHGATGAAAAGPSGAMGSRQSQQHNRRYEIQRRDERPHTGQTAREQVARMGVFQALGSPAAALPGSAIATPFASMLTASGEGDRDANGNMNGDLVGDAAGFGGLGPVGTGISGGGDARDTIGTGRLGTQGHGNCLPGQDCTFGSAHGNHLGPRENHGPRVTPSRPEITGMIAPDVIRRVVLRNIGRVNHCYEQGLASNPELAGRVSIRFVITGGGSVMTSNVSDSSLGVPSVSACIAGVVQQMTFPVPNESPAITVTYPFSLMPADH